LRIGSGPLIFPLNSIIRHEQTRRQEQDSCPHGPKKRQARHAQTGPRLHGSDHPGLAGGFWREPEHDGPPFRVFAALHHQLVQGDEGDQTRRHQVYGVTAWLETPNEAFDGSTPLQVIERGESDRLWRMIYFLRSGEPS
jgi:hypothetical protein